MWHFGQPLSSLLGCVVEDVIADQQVHYMQLPTLVGAGMGSQGQLGTGVLVPNRLQPVAVVGDYLFLQISAGHHFTCGILINGSAVCWGELVIGCFGRVVLCWQRISCTLLFAGDGSNGRLGTGSGSSSHQPVFVAGGVSFKEISANYQHTCGLLVNGQAVCWGACQLCSLPAVTSAQAFMNKAPLLSWVQVLGDMASLATVIRLLLHSQ
jgi:alpha-tubulin suppressor-like RCC1 family protein